MNRSRLFKVLKLYLTENSNKAIISAGTKRGLGVEGRGGKGRGYYCGGSAALMHLLLCAASLTTRLPPFCKKEEDGLELQRQGLHTHSAHMPFFFFKEVRVLLMVVYCPKRSGSPPTHLVQAKKGKEKIERNESPSFKP